MDSAYAIFGAMLVSLVLFQLNQRVASPVLAIVNRWLRWIIFSAGGALIAIDFGWISRPFWAVALAFSLIWFLCETLYNWLAIQALSISPLPLFPRFVANTSGEEWPTAPRLLKVRDWLRANDFKLVQSLKAEVGPSVYLRVSVYQDMEAQIRIQVTFLPQTNGAISVCYSLSSQTVSGFRYVTDNLYLPFGGFYPENWLVERNPWRRSLDGLVKRHRQRLSKAREMLLPWSTDPLNDLNSQQRELEQVNTELGFLLPHADREDFGKMSYEGRYRVWQEIWLLNYFGRSKRYE
ncbi:hypothetical protein DB347_17210 [Opitutaceae bacterium EW11]|nr:hypothetical protein DB347_17210 [Opitutaceae bacterium EW11]